jgi:hypothetical protein
VPGSDKCPEVVTRDDIEFRVVAADVDQDDGPDFSTFFWWWFGGIPLLRFRR